MSQNFAEKIVQFKLIDVDGVLLDNPGDILLSREPEGFKDVDITLERDVDTHGVFYEYASEDSEFSFDRMCKVSGELYDPYTFLLAVYGRVGIDSNIEFVVAIKNNALSSEVIEYTGKLTFSTFRLVDYKISLNSKRVTLSDKFRTRIDTKVNFGDTTSIDGTAITGISPVDTFLHGKAIITSQYATSTGSATSYELGLVDDWFLQLDYSTEKYSILGDDFVVNGYKNGLNREYSESDFTGLSDFPYVNYIFTENGILDIDYRARYIVSLQNFGGSTINYLGTFISVNGEETLISVPIAYPPSGSGLTVCPVSFEYQGSLSLRKNDQVSIYDKWTIPRTSSLTQTWRVSTNTPIDDHRMGLDFTGVADSSIAETYTPFNSVNHVLESITDQIDVLESDFITDNANDIHLTNGYKIRAFEDRSIITDFDSLFKGWLQPMFGLGYTIYNPFGLSDDVFKLKIEPYDFFYQDREVFNIGTIVNDTFEIVIDQDLIYNEIEVGYKDYPKSTDENKGNNIDEFNTLHSNLTPITTLKAKKQYISGVIGSGYKIENQRREQFKDVPSDTVSDDDNLFCINTIDSDVYEIYGDNVAPIYSIIADSTENTLSLLGTYFDYQALDDINVDRIGGGSSIEGDYTINSVEILGDRFILNCVDVPIGGSSTSNYLLTRDTLRRRALRNEEFDSLTGVISPSTVYNAGLNPKLMMLNHGSIFNSGFTPKPDTDFISVREAKLNDDMTYDYSVGQGGYNKDVTQTRRMGDNVELQNVDNYDKLFDGLTYSFQSNLSYDDVMTIRSYYLNELNNPDNMGYICFTDPFGQEREGFLMSIIYNPFRENVEFVLRGKFEPSGGAFDYVLDEVLN